MLDAPNVGGVDFVATTIAINMAVEFWQPVRDKLLKKPLARVVKRVDEIESHVTLCNLEKNTKDLLKNTCGKSFEEIKDGVLLFERNTLRAFNFMANISAFVALVLLYLGITHYMNALLLLPFPIFIAVSKWGKRKYKNKIKNVKYQLDTAVAAHVFEQSKIDSDFELDV